MFIIVLLIPLLTYQPNQGLQAVSPNTNPVIQESAQAPFQCSQPPAERDPLIHEAVENQFLVRRIEFLGNEYTRDDVLRRRVLLQEGDIFTLESLVKSLESVSRLKKIIYPVKLGDVMISLNRPEKIVDMTICFKERRRTRRGTKRGAGKRAI